jgi:hypothetical protein
MPSPSLMAWTTSTRPRGCIPRSQFDQDWLSRPHRSAASWMVKFPACSRASISRAAKVSAGIALRCSVVGSGVDAGPVVAVMANSLRLANLVGNVANGEWHSH